MKMNRTTRLLTATLGLAVLTVAGCAEKEKTANSTTAPAATPSSATHSATGDPTALGASTWTSIKDTTYDGRTMFVAGIASMEAELDNQIAALAQKRAALDGSANTTNWDLAMKELETARTNLKGTIADANRATPETWNQMKDKIGQAWVTTQNAISKVKTSTTMR